MKVGHQVFEQKQPDIVVWPHITRWCIGKLHTRYKVIKAMYKSWQHNSAKTDDFERNQQPIHLIDELEKRLKGQIPTGPICEFP